MKIVKSILGLNKMTYKVELTEEEKFMSNEELAQLLDRPLGDNYIVSKFENQAEIVVYND